MLRTVRPQFARTLDNDMAKRPQRQRNEAELDFELRKIGYLKRGLADLPGQALDAFPTLLALLRRAAEVSMDDRAPLNAASATVRQAVDAVNALNQPAGRVLTLLYGLDPSAADLTPEARYDLASSAFGTQFERATRPGNRRHAFGLLARTLAQLPETAPAPLHATKFVTLDDPSVPSARDVLAHASQLRVRTRSGAALLTGYKALIREMLAHGGELQLLTLLPGSAAADSAYGSASLFEANHTVATACVRQLAEDVPGAAICWRETSEPTSVSQIIAMRHGAPAVSLVQINLVYAAQGRERPVAVLEEHDHWFTAFADEFEHIWSSGSTERQP